LYRIAKPLVRVIARISPLIVVPAARATPVNKEELVIPGAVMLAIVVVVRMTRDTYVLEGAVRFPVPRTIDPFRPKFCLESSLALFAALWPSSIGRGAVPSGYRAINKLLK
jgi:hypothetical protein